MVRVEMSHCERCGGHSTALELLVACHFKTMKRGGENNRDPLSSSLSLFFFFNPCALAA
jgi:hypothetical protein